MKKTVYLLIALMAVFASCEKNEIENENGNTQVETNDSIFYAGTLTANASSGDCVTPDTEVSINPTAKADSISISIYKAKLASRMPAMDIVIPNITVSKSGDVTVLSSETSIPLAMGSEFPKYTVTEFNGEIIGEELTFSLKFRSTPTSFSGQLLK